MAAEAKGKVALITGAASGIGRACVELFVNEGVAVAVADIDRPGGEALVARVSGTGGRVGFFPVDVSDAESMRALVDSVVERFGGFDVLVNNAGVQRGGQPIHAVSEADFDAVIAINLRSVFLGMKYGIPVLLKRGGGRIVNTASAGGLKGFPLQAAYAASKGGVIQLTRTAALEYAQANIQVNCVCPSFIDTPLVAAAREALPEALRARITTPLGRIGTADEVARTIAFLAFGPSFISGSAVVIDGALTA